MALVGALTGKEKLKSLEKKKEKIALEMIKIIGIISEGLGSQYNCFIDTRTEINIIPNEKVK